jgi:hypothetical protein
VRNFAIFILSLAVLAAVGCGSSGSGSSKAGGNTIAGSAANVAPIVVDGGPAGLSTPDFNMAFVTVTVCNPTNTSSCNTIDHVQVDTGSVGLRLVSSLNGAGGELNLNLPAETDATGNTITECAEFLSNVSYGTVRTANITIAGETATGVSGSSQPGVPIQVIGDVGISTTSDCLSLGVPMQSTLQSLGANGILGIGLEQTDCGSGCLASSPQAQSSNPVIYYSCSPTAPTSCTDTYLSSPDDEVINPVVLFPTDNNGTIVQLPGLSSTTAGQNNVSGSLVFGIGTQSNNALGSAHIFLLDQYDNFTTVNANTDYEGFTDSGSNGMFFNPADTPSLTNNVCSDFYCPPSPVNFTGTTVENQSASTSTTQGVTFSVVSASTLNPPSSNAYNALAGPISSGTNLWDWGLPFFFGRNVYTAIDGQNNSQGNAPFIAY